MAAPSKRLSRSGAHAIAGPHNEAAFSPGGESDRFYDPEPAPTATSPMYDAPAPTSPSAQPGLPGRFAQAFRRRLSKASPAGDDPETATDEVLYSPPHAQAPTSTLRDDLSPRKRQAGTDVIDSLDNSGLGGDATFHHASAYDAVTPHGTNAFHHPLHNGKRPEAKPYMEEKEDDYTTRSRGQRTSARSAGRTAERPEGVYRGQGSGLASRGLLGDLAPDPVPKPEPISARMRSQSSHGTQGTETTHSGRPYGHGRTGSGNPLADMWGHAEEPWEDFATPAARRSGERNNGMYSSNSSTTSLERTMRNGMRSERTGSERSGSSGPPVERAVGGAPRSIKRSALAQSYAPDLNNGVGAQDPRDPTPANRPRVRRSKSFLELVGLKSTCPSLLCSPTPPLRVPVTDPRVCVQKTNTIRI